MSHFIGCKAQKISSLKGCSSLWAFEWIRPGSVFLTSKRHHLKLDCGHRKQSFTEINCSVNELLLEMINSFQLQEEETPLKGRHHHEIREIKFSTSKGRSESICKNEVYANSVPPVCCDSSFPTNTEFSMHSEQQVFLYAHLDIPCLHSDTQWQRFLLLGQGDIKQSKIHSATILQARKQAIKALLCFLRPLSLDDI